MAHQFNSYRPLAKLLPTQGWQGTVNYFSELPLAQDKPLELFLVLQDEVDNLAGFYLSDSVTWDFLDKSKYDYLYNWLEETNTRIGIQEAKQAQDLIDTYAYIHEKEDESEARDSTLQDTIDLKEEESKQRDINNNTYTDTVVANAIDNLELQITSEEVHSATFTITVTNPTDTLLQPYSGFVASNVFINGVHQLPNVAYTVEGKTFTFAEELQTGDTVHFLLGMSLELSDSSTIEVEHFTATEGQQTFILENINLSNTKHLVFIQGVKQSANSFIINGNEITFDEALTEGTYVEVLVLNRVQESVDNLSAILQMDKVITSNATIMPNKNAISISPEIADGVTVTVSDGSNWFIY